MTNSFDLYDLRIEVHQREGKPMVCNHPKGSYFYLFGENLTFPKGVTFPIYSLAALIPILPAKQRETHQYDWMSTDHYIACPDPHCGGMFKIVRLPKKRNFLHHEVSKVPINEIPKIIIGCWQLSNGHQKQVMDNSNELLFKYTQAGLNTFDCADIYQGVEDKLGQFKKLLKDTGSSIRIHTKFVPDLHNLANLEPDGIVGIIQRSCERLQVTSLDLVQFHWWNYSTGDYLAALHVLKELQTHGIIKNIGLTNFNTKHLRRIVESDIKITSIQVQYSLLDKRPEKSLIEYAQMNNIKILAYGILAGGFFNEKWLGKVEPDELANRSLVKYKLIIDEFGGWYKFQELLYVINEIAINYQLSIADFVTVYMLRYTQVDSVVIGISRSFNKNVLDLLDKFVLSKQELAFINKYSESSISGDVYDLERDVESRHAGIMKYDLNTQ